MTLFAQKIVLIFLNDFLFLVKNKIKLKRYIK